MNITISSNVDTFGRAKRSYDDTPVRRGRSPPRGEWGSGQGYVRSGRQRSRSRTRDSYDRPYRDYSGTHSSSHSH